MPLGVLGASLLVYGCSAGRSADVTVVSVYAGNSEVVEVEGVAVVVPVVGDDDFVWIAAAAAAAAAAAVGVAAAADVAAVGVGHCDLLSGEFAAAVFADCAVKFEAEVAEDLTRSSVGAPVGCDLSG